MAQSNIIKMQNHIEISYIPEIPYMEGRGLTNLVGSANFDLVEERIILNLYHLTPSFQKHVFRNENA